MVILFGFAEGIGAFLTGVSSVVGAGITIRLVVKYCDKKCDQRMEAFREGLDRGKG